MSSLLARHQGGGRHLCLHGPQHGSAWHEVAWRLAHDHRVIGWSMGLSDRLAEGCAAATQAGDLAAPLDARGIGTDCDRRIPETPPDFVAERLRVFASDGAEGRRGIGARRGANR